MEMALKLEEAMLRFLGRGKPPGLHTAVDLGAAPGGWSWQLARLGIDLLQVHFMAAMENHHRVQARQGIDFRGQCALLSAGRALVAPVVDCIFEFGEGEHGGIS